MKQFLFWDWVDHEAAKIHSDGCSCVPDFYLKCCKIHDLGYWYAKDPYHAYNLYRQGEAHYWCKARPVVQKNVDAMLRACIQKGSWFGRYSPMAWWRYWALREFGRKAWNSHAKTHESSQCI